MIKSNETISSSQDHGWLIVHGGGSVANEIKERFIALAGGPNARFVLIPTAMSDEEIEARGFLKGEGRKWARSWGIGEVKMLHRRDRARADSEEVIEVLRSACGIWILGGRQWRLAKAYLDTAVERELKGVFQRGGVVGGSSAGATILGSFLIRSAPGDASNPDGDYRILTVPEYERGLGLLANCVIDQHVNTRLREGDLDSVISVHPKLLGIGIDENVAIVVHRDSFFVVGGRVAIHDGGNHDGTGYYFLSSGQAFNLGKRSVDDSQDRHSSRRYSLTLTVTAATRVRTKSGIKTVGSGLLKMRKAVRKKSRKLLISNAMPVFTALGNIDTLRDRARPMRS